MATVSCCESMNEKFRKAKAPGKLSICKLWKREGRADLFGVSFLIQAIQTIQSFPLGFNHSIQNPTTRTPFRKGHSLSIPVPIQFCIFQKYICHFEKVEMCKGGSWCSYCQIKVWKSLGALMSLPRERVHGTMSWSKGPCPAQLQTQWIDRDYNLYMSV